MTETPAPTSVPTLVPAPAPPSRQLGVKVHVPHLTFRVFCGNPKLMQLLLFYGVECKCRVIFAQFHVYFIVTDEAIAILLQTEVARLHILGLTVAFDDLRTMLFTRLFTRLQPETACTREYVTVKEYDALVLASSGYMTTFFRQHRPVNEEYGVYLRVCAFFKITPYTSLAVVNALWSLALTVRGALL